MVVGAGPAGLCAAWYARKRGWEPLIVDAGCDVGGAWQRMDPGMKCLSPRKNDCMPDGRIPNNAGAVATAADVVDMLTAFQRDSAFELHLNARVETVEKHKHGFRLLVAGESMIARRLVAATGEFGAPRWPNMPGLDLYASEHASTLDRSSVQVDERVVVVGSGNSGAEVALALVARGAQVTMSCRTPLRTQWHVPGFLTQVGWKLSGVPLRYQPNRGGCRDKVPVQGSELKSAVDSGLIRTVGETKALVAGGVLVESETFVPADRVVFCTGYLRDDAWLGRLVERDDSGFPVHDDGLIPGVPGLAVVGLPCLRTWRSGFLRGFSADASAVIGRMV